MSIKKSIFKIFNGTSWDEYYHKTSADQVVYTKPDGTASNVQAELAEQNSAYLKLMQSDGLPGAAMKFYKAENLTYGCFATGCYIYSGYSTGQGAPDDWGGLLIVYKTPESYVKYALTRGGAIYHMINKSDGQVEQSWTKLCGKY